MILAAVGDGIITGAQNYVWAAYILTWLGLGLYGISLVIREIREKEIDGDQK